jgi:phosphoribosylglycinamide formyltransferase 1
MPMTRQIAVFASGSGTNAQNIIRYFAQNPHIKVSCLLSNNSSAYALTRATQAGIDTMIFSRDQLYNSSEVITYLVNKRIDLIVLAGFLWLIPKEIIDKFKIINIHPALLPKYGGKNMYGHYVHEAVIQNGEKYSGITIHHVNEKYDEGDVIFQATCNVEPGDTPETLAERIHLLEYKHYPAVIEQVINQL